MSFKFDGFDDLQKELKQLERKAQELDGTHEVPFVELFNNSFMKQYTKFSSFDEFLKAGGFIVETDKDFEAIPDDEFDQHVANHSSFSDWEEMLDTASSDYLTKQLGF